MGVHRLLPFGLPVLLLLAACSSDGGGPVRSAGSSTSTSVATTTTTAAPAETCSASGIRIQLVAQDLPAPIAATRRALFEAAVACDYDRLEAISKEGDGTVHYTFGGDDPEGMIGHWRRMEADGQPVLKDLALVLNLPNVQRDIQGGHVYRTWPSADQEHRTAADWDALVGLYTEEEVAAFRKDDMYLGWRAGIRDDGDWMYFVSGD